MMASRDVVRAVIRIPRDFSTRGDVSFHALVVESEYLDERHVVSVEDIERALHVYPELVADWLNYSEDKRSCAGWYFRRAEIGCWVVGFAGGGGADESSLAYDDEIRACAAFVKRELDAISEFPQ